VATIVAQRAGDREVVPVEARADQGQRPLVVVRNGRGGRLVFGMLCVVGGPSMKRVIVLLTVALVLCVAILPSPASAGGSWRGGHRGGHGGWWPGAVIGGLAFGAVAIVTAPILALSAAAASVAEQPPVVYAPPTYSAPPPYYSVPPAYSAPPTYSAPPPYSAPSAYSAPPAYVPPPTTYRQAPSHASAQVALVQREVVYANGRYVLYGDGVHQPWQWVWVPSASPPPPPPPPR
jgi:hypothetical protein